MNKKMILATLLMTPAVWCAHDMQSNEMRIKELEEVRFQKETEIARLSRKIHEERIPYLEYREIALRFWNSSEDRDKEIYFDKFIIELCRAFEACEDTEALCKEAPLIETEHTNVHLFVLRVALQFLFIERLINQYKNHINALTCINKELMNLKSKNI